MMRLVATRSAPLTTPAVDGSRSGQLPFGCLVGGVLARRVEILSRRRQRDRPPAPPVCSGRSKPGGCQPLQTPIQQRPRNEKRFTLLDVSFQMIDKQ